MYLNLCSKLAPNGVPTYVSVKAEYDAEIDSCFENVIRKVNRDGGHIVHGWQIWDWTGVLIEAEFHAIWVSPNGEYIDITPKNDDEKQILFLPDTFKKWTGKYVDNVRQPLITTQLFKDLETVSKRIIFELNRSERAKGGVIINPKIFLPLQEIKNFISILLNERGNIESYCPCNSGRKYKNCHRKNLIRS